MDGRSNLFATEVSELTAGFAGDVSSLPHDHLLRSPHLIGMVLKLTELFLALAAEAHDVSSLSLGVIVVPILPDLTGRNGRACCQL